MALYKKPDLLEERISEEKLLIYDIGNKRTFVLNASAVSMMNLCAGISEGDLIAEYINKHSEFTNDITLLTSDARKTVEQLLSVGLIEDLTNE